MKDYRSQLKFILLISLFLLISSSFICCSSFTIHLFSLLIGISFYAVLTVLFFTFTNNISWAITVLFIVNSLLSVFNKVKISLLKDVITFKDVYLIKNLFYVDAHRLLKTIDLKLILMLLVSIGLFVFIHKLRMKNSWYFTFKYRVTVFLGCILSIYLLVQIVSVSVRLEFIPDLQFRPDWNIEFNGYPIVLLQALKSTRMDVPKGYSKEKLLSIVNKIKVNNGELSNKRPNIIIILSESFIYPEDIDLHYNYDVVSNIHKVRRNSMMGRLTVPVFGGLTANTEHELFTGFGIKELPAYVVPYQDFLHLEYPNYINYFKSLGYKTIAFHNYFGWFWNRRLVYKKYGFDEFISIEQITKKYSEIKMLSIYPLDKYLFQEITNKLDQDRINPQFLFAITVQTHGLYGLKWPDSKLEIVSPNTLSQETRKGLLDYGNRLNLCDQDFKKLIEYLKSYPRETIVVYFGDHLPPLFDYYEEIGLMEREGWDKLSYSTPYFIWSNKRQLSGKKDFKITALMSYLIDITKLPKRKYDEFLFKSLSNGLVEDDYQMIIYDQMFGKKYGKKMFELIGD